MTEQPVLLDAQQVAQQLQVSERVVKGLARRGEIRAVKVGRSMRFTPDEITRYINRNLR